MFNFVFDQKDKNMKHLTEAQRYTISVLLSQGFNQKKIAEAIGVCKSTICRELKRNSNNRGVWSRTQAAMCVAVRKERYNKVRKFTSSVEKFVKEHLKLHWSPEQIVGYCKKHDIPMVSVERIYQYIRADKDGGGMLYKLCRHKLKHRKRSLLSQNKIKNRVSIDERPAEADGTRFGDWEMDLIVGPNNKDAMITFVERMTGFTIIEELPNGKKAKELSQIAIKALFPYIGRIKSITTDNGSEFACHEHIAKKLKTKIYFTHPYSSWEKGLIEYTNKLYRQYIPKKTSFKNFNKQKIKEIQYEINKRPRKKLNFSSPLEVFFSLCNKKVAFRC